MTITDHISRLPFTEALEYLRNKLTLPTTSWTDIWQAQHALAFVIAGATHDAMLEDMYAALVKARTDGIGFKQFQQDFERIATKYGWGYRGSADWRARIIYDTNITQAHNAGRWWQMEALRDTHPYLQYHHSHRSFVPRKEHLSWDGLIIHRDDPWWRSHYPANGWGCKCYVTAMTAGEVDRMGQKPSAPTIEYEQRIVGKRGATPRAVRVPKGIDAGFDYNVGDAYLRPHTAPMLEGYDAVLQQRDVDMPAPDVPIPSPRTWVHGLRNKPTTQEQQLNAASSFLGTFGATLERSAVYTDKTGSPIVVGADLFRNAQGEYKWTKGSKGNRLQYTDMLAATLINPQEIWWHWEQDHSNAGNWRLKRRYLAHYKLGDRDEYAIVSFEWGRRGWAGSTAFVADRGDRQRYYNNQRLGRLNWRD